MYIRVHFHMYVLSWSLFITVCKRLFSDGTVKIVSVSNCYKIVGIITNKRTLNYLQKYIVIVVAVLVIRKQ